MDKPSQWNKYSTFRSVCTYRNPHILPANRTKNRPSAVFGELVRYEGSSVMEIIENAIKRGLMIVTSSDPLLLQYAVLSEAENRSSSCAVRLHYLKYSVPLSKISWSFSNGVLKYRFVPFLSECPILPSTRPSGEVMPSIAQTEPFGL